MGREEDYGLNQEYREDDLREREEEDQEAMDDYRERGEELKETVKKGY